MSTSAYKARLKGLARWKRPRTYEQSQRIKLEIALRTLRGETFRGMTQHLGLRSYCYCRRTAIRFLAGQMPMFPLSEAGLLEMLRELDEPRVRSLNPSHPPFPREAIGYSGRCLRCHVRVYNKTEWLCGGCSQLWLQISRDLEHDRMNEAEAARAWFLPSNP
jgi:hypothetical protein